MATEPMEGRPSSGRRVLSDAERQRVRQLLADYRRILAELRVLDVIRTNDAPTGGYAESLVVAAFDGKQAKSAANEDWDVELPLTNGDGTPVRVQVKAQMDDTKAGNLSPLHSDKYPVIVIEFRSDDFGVKRACWVAVNRLQTLCATKTQYDRGWKLSANSLFAIGDPDTHDLTERLLKASGVPA